jgi:hypothetical protein
VATKLKSPHLFNAGSNPINVINNLTGLLAPAQLQILRDEIRANVKSLFRLGESHYQFATNLAPTEWRQRISRLYYGAYNVRRAVALEVDGSFSTDSIDHKNIGQIPDDFPGAATYRVRMTNLREDRNLADYNHLAVEGDLVIPPTDYELIVRDFINEARNYLVNRGAAV